MILRNANERNYIKHYDNRALCKRAIVKILSITVNVCYYHVISQITVSSVQRVVETLRVKYCGGKTLKTIYSVRRYSYVK